MQNNINFKNLEAHYSTNGKAVRTGNIVANPPEQLSGKAYFSDYDANNKLKLIEQEIHYKKTREEKKSLRTFLKVMFGLAVTTVLFLIGKKLFKKS